MGAFVTLPMIRLPEDWIGLAQYVVGRMISGVRLNASYMPWAAMSYLPVKKFEFQI